MDFHDTTARGRVLLADEDDAFRWRLGTELTQRGFDVVDSRTASEAISIVTSTDIDYAVVELRFAGDSGLEIIEALQRARPQARAIVLTGYGDTATAVAAVKLGAVDYLAKPETADGIVAALLAPEGDQPPPPCDPISPNEARRQHIAAVYEAAGGNVSHAARLLKMHRRTLQRILKRSDAHARGTEPEPVPSAASRQHRLGTQDTNARNSVAPAAERRA